MFLPQPSSPGIIEGGISMLTGSLRRSLLLSSFFALAIFAAGCKKKTPVTPPAPTPAPAAAQPTVSINASPSTIAPGGTTTLTWTSTDATDLQIAPGVGKVVAQGSTPVNPTESTTYTITATGPGGSATASTSVTVNAPAAAPAPTNNQSLSELFQQNVQDAFFDFNKSDIREDARAALTKDAEFLRSYPEIRVTLEGHCDDRGSTEYNIGLGERRAQAAKNYLISLGIAASRIDTVSYGKERPFCTEENEACWQQNRRAHFVYAH
jgi:peptidoglycan-associated lipoprotein